MELLLMALKIAAVVGATCGIYFFIRTFEYTPGGYKYNKEARGYIPIHQRYASKTITACCISAVAVALICIVAREGDAPNMMPAALALPLICALLLLRFRWTGFTSESHGFLGMFAILLWIPTLAGVAHGTLDY